MTEREVFLQVLDIHNPAERADFLDRACADQPVLRAQVDQLLKAHELADQFLDRPYGPAGAGDRTGTYASESSAQEAAGTVIAGKYKLLQRIGEGGMGSVWMADQMEPVKRRVAVKLISGERGNSKNILSRFEAERQAIALMDHPHIAKLLDAGSTQGEKGGSPFFVMELVKGVPLTDFCDEHKLTIPERLHLFVQICGAVQHAHQKGIIHRDLKPTNILVELHDDRPVPRVIDFGLAKALSGQPLTEHTLFTGFGTVAGTPLYMAPEQAKFNAIDIDTRADIYALGVILYELLTGSTPIERATLKEAAFDEILRVIRESEPPTPSRRLSTRESKPSVAANRHTEPKKLGRFVKGDLDWIVMKALAKERDRRYPTATGLARDIERFLNHEPVLAGPPSASYRLRKFVRRNRGRVVAAMLVFLALLGGIIGTTVGLIRAEQLRLVAEANERKATKAADAERQARLRAEKNFQLAQAAVDKGFTRVSETVALKALPLEKLRKDLLAQAKDFYENLVAEHSDEPGLQAERGRSYLRLAQITIELGDRLQAIALLQQARALFDGLRRDQPKDISIQDALASSLEALGDNYYETGSMQNALDADQRALELREALAQSGSANDRYRLAMAQNHLGMVYSRGLGRVADGQAFINRAMELCEGLIRQSPASSTYVVAQADILRNLGRLKNIEADYAAAVAAYTRELALRERLAKEDPGAIVYQDGLGRCLMSLASQAMKIGQLARAQKSRDQAVVIFEHLIHDHPDVPEHKNMLARTLVTGAQVTCLMGNYKEAIAEVEKGVAIAPGDGLTCGNAGFSYNSIFRAVGRDTKLPRAERERLAESYACRAVELFRQSKKAGFYQRRGSVTSLINDPELSVLRERADFKALMRELESDGQRSSNSPQSIK